MVTPTGTVNQYPDNPSGSVPDEITVGPDGNLWVTDYNLPAVWKVTVPGRTGRNRVRFAGRIGRGVRLAPGDYRVSIMAISAAGRSAVRMLVFRIV